MSPEEREIAKMIIIVLLLVGTAAWASGTTLPSVAQGQARAAREVKAVAAGGASLAGTAAKVAKWLK